MKKAFTLVELLVVIGIIGILAGVLMATFGGATEAARAAKCAVNIRSLAIAATAASMEPGRWYYASGNKSGELGKYPIAGSISGGDSAYGGYQEYVGWISWLSEGEFKPRDGDNKSPKYGSTIKNCPYYGTGDAKKDHWALSHGSLWHAIGQTSEPYVCPTHSLKCQKVRRRTPLFSYVMNMWFGCDLTDGADYIHQPTDKLSLRAKVNGSIPRADRKLMFAEIDGGLDGKEQEGESESCPPEHDCVLQYKVAVDGERLGQDWQGTKSESIGFPHVGNGNKAFGHVAFADGHVEKFIKPKAQSGSLTKEQLTAALCEGWDVLQKGETYKSLKNEGDVY